MFHTSHKVWVYLHNKRQGLDDPRWELDQNEINNMKPSI